MIIFKTNQADTECSTSWLLVNTDDYWTITTQMFIKKGLQLWAKILNSLILEILSKKISNMLYLFEFKVQRMNH